MAGIEVLLNESGVPVEELDEIIMAGAFGTFLNLDTAVAIHLVPDAPLEKFNQIGNAAGVITSYSIHYTKLYEVMSLLACRPVP